MRKSSLGRRSSTHIPVRVPSLGGGNQRTSGGKRSGIKQPGYTQINRRSRSEDRESYGGAPLPGSLVRSNTGGNLSGRNLGTMTPITPCQSLHANLPTGSVRAPRSQTMSYESNRRMSSFGGTKNVRKDSRPLTEKPFQQAAQAKVQQYFSIYGSHIVNPGNTIRPMNTKLFVDMMDHLLKNFDSRIVITKSNYLEELPLMMRKFGYRSKIDRSWLMTVNTPHSWPHVIGILSWLVDVIELMDAVVPYDMMFTNNLSEPEEVQDDEDEPISKELILHLKKTYKQSDDPTVENPVVEEMNSEYIEKQIVDLKCTDDDFISLQRETDLVKEELDSESKRRDAVLEEFEKLQAKHNAAQNDYQIIEKFIEDSNQFLSSTEVKITTMEQEIVGKKALLAKKQEDLQKLQDKVSSQQISMNQKDEFMKEKQNLMRMIQFHENSIREYEKSAFTVDLKCAEDRRKLDKLILDYNKLVAENVIVEPRLKDVEVEFTLLSELEDASLNTIDNNLKTLKEGYKNKLITFNSRKEECENILWRTKQDIKETQEEITKETALLEGVECDLKKQEELINKETQQLKEKCNRYQKATKEIMNELSQLDKDKLEDKKLELKKIEHDWHLVKKRGKQLMEKEIEIQQEIKSKICAKLEQFKQKHEDFRQNHLQ